MFQEGFFSRLLRNNSYIIDAQDILCFISKFHATFLHTQKAEYICELSLNHLEKRLNPQDFIRLHRNNIVRFDAVTAISHQGRMAVTLRNGMVLPVSKNNRKTIKDYFLKFSK